jgi:hypothetical protein
MPSFFVWSGPSYTVILEAYTEQDAAEAFLGRSAKAKTSGCAPPACFVQPADESAGQREHVSAMAFWIEENAIEIGADPATG